jgi:predicted  nucleic acid-binding Zn-ribbon protein
VKRRKENEERTPHHNSYAHLALARETGSNENVESLCEIKPKHYNLNIKRMNPTKEKVITYPQIQGSVYILLDFSVSLIQLTGWI